MKKLAAATIVAKRCLSLARVLVQSFHQFHPAVPFFVLLADEPEGCFSPQDEPFPIIVLDEHGLSAATAMRFRYGQQALSYALTPFFLSHLLDQGFEAVAFFKQESLVLDSLAPVLAALEHSAIVLTPHILAPLTYGDAAERERNIIQSGMYNVGFVGVTRHPEAYRFLAWWQERTVDHCHHAVEHGIHYEQRWLDLVPGYFAHVQIVRDPGFNVAHWNLPDRQIRLDGDQVFAVDVPCRFMRFSGFDPAQPEVPTRYNARLSSDTLGPAALLFQRYHHLLEAAGYRETCSWPYAYSRFDNGVAIPDVVRSIYAQCGSGHIVFGNPFSTDPGSFFAWLHQPADLPGDTTLPMSQLWHAIYHLRPDLQAAFPDFAGSDLMSFLAWVATTGRYEHCIPDELMTNDAAGTA